MDLFLEFINSWTWTDVWTLAAGLGIATVIGLCVERVCNGKWVWECYQ